MSRSSDRVSPITRDYRNMRPARRRCFRALRRGVPSVGEGAIVGRLVINRRVTDEATENAQEALALYVEGLRDEGRPVGAGIVRRRLAVPV
jgi:hypothetical protein